MEGASDQLVDAIRDALAKRESRVLDQDGGRTTVAQPPVGKAQQLPISGTRPLSCSASLGSLLLFGVVEAKAERRSHR